MRKATKTSLFGQDNQLFYKVCLNVSTYVKIGILALVLTFWPHTQRIISSKERAAAVVGATRVVWLPGYQSIGRGNLCIVRGYWSSG